MSTNISWTNETWNPVIGCSKVSEGCRNCYAMRVAKGLADKHVQHYDGLTKIVNGKPEWTNVVRCLDDRLKIPLSWKKPRMVFVNSMSDLFHPDVPFEFIDRVFGVMALCPQHTFQILTKRPERMAEYPQRDWCADDHIAPFIDGLHDDATWQTRHPLTNVWLGTSVEDQKAADERIPHLLNCPAAVRFLSVEPLLDQVCFYEEGFVCKRCGTLLTYGLEDEVDYELPCRKCDSNHYTYGYPSNKANLGSGDHTIDWVIVGGESGPNHRQMPMDAFERVCQQTVDAGVPLFVKQDSGFKSEQRGRISDKWWGYKEFPPVRSWNELRDMR